MVRTQRHPAVFAEVDAKRIAGNSLAIALHAAVLALLMMPSTWSPPGRPASTVPPIVVVPVDKRPEIPEIMPPPPTPVVPVRPQQPVTQPVRITEVPAAESAEVMDTGTEQAIAVDEGAVVESFDTGTPPVTTLAYDVHPAPRYPRVAMRNGDTGTVLLRVLVDASGQPQEVSIERSSGHRELDRAARDQVLARWRFHPAQRDGRRITAYALVPVEFSLPR